MLTVSGKTTNRKNLPPHPIRERLTRAKFEELNLDLFKKTLTPVQNVLRDASMAKKEVLLSLYICIYTYIYIYMYIYIYIYVYI